MQGAGGGHLTLRFKHKEGDRAIKAMPIGGDKEKTAVHAAMGRGQAAAADVLKRLPRLQQGLLPDHAQPLNFLNVPDSIGDLPMARDQLRGHRTLIGEGDGVGELVIRLARLLCAGVESGDRFNFKMVGRHALMVTATIRA